MGSMLPGHTLRGDPWLTLTTQMKWWLQQLFSVFKGEHILVAFTSMHRINNQSYVPLHCKQCVRQYDSSHRMRCNHQVVFMVFGNLNQHPDAVAACC